jgi:hypothetical protein
MLVLQDGKIINSLSPSIDDTINKIRPACQRYIIGRHTIADDE